MIDRHYGHLSRPYTAAEVAKGMPRFFNVEGSNIRPLRWRPVAAWSGARWRWSSRRQIEKKSIAGRSRTSSTRQGWTAPPPPPPSPGNMRRQLRRFAKAVRRESKALHPMVTAWHLLSLSEQLAARAEALADAIVVPPGSRRWDDRKFACAVFACDILREAGRKPTLTVDGPFYQLTSILLRRSPANLTSIAQPIAGLP
jgi:hypothetical protein